ncbi:PREDICTED: uncharacterized protein LOC108771988 [Cyphomyrmex costatus]|nr:PREDICTED: uncharacterized protein LOC108771988 [Cyphomyrmex costatus]
MDFHNGVVLLPYTKILDETLHKWFKSNYDDCCIKKLSIQKSIVHDLFYDGMWQQPVKNTYWTHNDSQWANATSVDINRCIDSAGKGFQVWSTKSITYRTQVLFQFASILRYNGKSALADLISSDIEKFSYICQNSLSCSQKGRLEVTKIRNSKGVVILKEEDETVLFCRLIQILTFGNSVIVICNTNSYSLAPYCNMFSTSAIPPGVINLLSNEDIKKLELALCGTNYERYAEQFFSENNIEKIYMNLTIPKQIILPLK